MLLQGMNLSNNKVVNKYISLLFHSFVRSLVSRLSNSLPGSPSWSVGFFVRSCQILWIFTGLHKVCRFVRLPRSFGSFVCSLVDWLIAFSVPNPRCRAVASKKFWLGQCQWKIMTEAISFLGIHRVLTMTTNNKNERNDWDQCLSLLLLACYGPAFVCSYIDKVSSF